MLDIFSRFDTIPTHEHLATHGMRICRTSRSKTVVAKLPRALNLSCWPIGSTVRSFFLRILHGVSNIDAEMQDLAINIIRRDSGIHSRCVNDE